MNRYLRLTISPDEVVWAFAGVRIVVAAFYALQDTRTPVMVAAIALVGNLVLSLVLRSITDVNVAERHSDEQLLKRNDGLNVVRYGIANQTTAQK